MTFTLADDPAPSSPDPDSAAPIAVFGARASAPGRRASALWCYVDRPPVQVRLLRHLVSHLEMMLQSRKGRCGPRLQVRVVPVFSVALEEIYCILVCLNLVFLVLLREIRALKVLQAVQSVFLIS
jgi:hypothetical protein